MSDTPTPGTLPPVELLENLLGRARAGEFDSLAVAMVKTDGCSAQNWTKQADFLCLIGSVMLLHGRILDAMSGREGDEGC